METMMKDSRCEFFSNGIKENEKIYKTKNTFYCSTQATNSTPQLLNRQKNTNSFKNLTNVEQIELETTNDIYEYNKNKNRINNVNSPMIKKEVSHVIDSYRDSDFNNDDNDGKGDKKVTNNLDKQKIASKQKMNLNTKLPKQNSSSNLLNSNFGSSSLITTKIQCDKNKKKTKKSKKNPKDKKHSSAANIHSVETNMMNDMFRTNEMNSTKLSLKIKNDSNQNSFKPIIKKQVNDNFNNKPFSAEKENIFNETLRWKFELQDPAEEEKRIDQYKQDRRRRYIEQRNKLSNNSMSFLPYLYYENIDTFKTDKNENDENIESTSTSEKDTPKLNNHTDSLTRRETDNEKNKSKENRSNITTDSAISSLSSSSRL